MGLLVGALCAVVGGALTYVLRPRVRLRAGEPVIVVAIRGSREQSIHGVVAADGRAGVSLHAAHLLAIGGDHTPMGDVVIERAAILFVQTGVAPVDLSPKARERPTPIPLPDTSRPPRLREA